VSAEDALEYLIAGASAIQVGSAHFLDPRAAVKIIDGIQNYLQRQGFPGLSSVIGSLKTGQDSGECR
jgi:dihydroorotate dehydrogenase (NAD+) catalytic subunit